MNKILCTLVAVLSFFGAHSQIIISGEIAANTTWNNDNIYLLSGFVYVRNGATLTIEPGTVIKGDFNTKGALIVERGGKLIADGTPEQPIVFTSQKAAGQRTYGDWGGVIICGRASLNQPANAGNGTAAGEAIVEGGVGSLYGGGATPDDNDNSGILRFVRIEFGGIPFQPNNEINGLTLGAVGRGTIVENVQVSYCGDDAFEWFGGTVNCKNLISYRNWDDDFDTDNGYSGAVQFGVLLRDPAIADQSGSNGFESDNDAQGTANNPNTRPVFSNMTVVGPFANNATTINTLYRRAAHIRRNSSCSIFNSVIGGYPTGLLIEGSSSQANAAANNLRIRNTVWAQMNDSLATLTTANPNNTNGAFNISDWFNTAGWNNSLANFVSDFNLNSVDLNNPDFTLAPNSPLNSGADFSDSYLNNSYITPVNYLGAFGATDWTSCWAEWDPINANYSQGIDNTMSAGIISLGDLTMCEGESVELTATADADGAIFRWSNGVEGASVDVSTDGEISVVAESIDGCLSAPQSVTVTVFVNPTVAISAEGPTVFCTGGSVVLSSTMNGGNVWSNNATSNSITVSNSGDYSVNYTDINGCSAVSNSISVNVSDSPVPTISLGGPSAICAGSAVTLTASQSDTYEWSLNGNVISGASAQVLEAAEAGLYTVTVTNSDQCNGVGTSQQVFVNVLPSPTAAGEANQALGSLQVDFQNLSTNTTSVLWNFGDGNTSTEFNPSHVYATGGDYTVSLTALNGTCTSTVTIQVQNVSVIDLDAARFSVYPNPATDQLFIEVSNAQSNYFLQMFDMSGRVVFSRNFNAASEGAMTVVSVNELNNGLYLLSIQGENGIQNTQRIIVQK